MKYDLAVFIGRFQPFHNGHKRVIEEALAKADKVLIIIGSAFAPRNYRNPFTYRERIDMIADAFPEAKGRIMYEPVQDKLYNDTAWVEDVQQAVDWRKDGAKKIALIGHERDGTSFYLKLFPQWESIGVEDYQGINSTHIRAEYFAETKRSLSTFYVPNSTFVFLANFSETEEYENIREEYEFVRDYKKQWSASPYPPIFVTVDACVVQSGHVLLVKRKERPGKGLWALPGGFLNQEERIADAVIRELREETKIKVPAPVLKGNVIAQRVFDHPNRSSRGRTITHAYLIQLPPDTKLPTVKGADDAEKAKWVPLADVERSMMFEDHYDMVQTLIGLL